MDIACLRWCPRGAEVLGIPDKNIQMLGDRSLIAWTGDALANAAFVDARVISTDSEDYAEEGRIHGLDAPSCGRRN